MFLFFAIWDDPLVDEAPDLVAKHVVLLRKIDVAIHDTGPLSFKGNQNCTALHGVARLITDFENLSVTG